MLSKNNKGCIIISCDLPFILHSYRSFILHIFILAFCWILDLKLIIEFFESCKFSCGCQCKISKNLKFSQQYLPNVLNWGHMGSIYNFLNAFCGPFSFFGVRFCSYLYRRSVTDSRVGFGVFYPWHKESYLSYFQRSRPLVCAQPNQYGNHYIC